MNRRRRVPRREIQWENTAYKDFETMWRASRFAMGVIRKMSEQWNCSVIEAYERLREIDEIESDLVFFYDILHTQGYEYIVPDILKKWEKHLEQSEEK